MANINIIVALSNSDPTYVDSTVRYARIDDTPTPTYTTISNVTDNPLVLSDFPNGQYRVYAKPNYTSGKNCPESFLDTVACTGITSLSAIFTDPNIVVSYSCDPSVPKVRINISYPNGGFSNLIVPNAGTDVNILPPAGVYGTYLVTIQPVCDEDSGFYGAATAPVALEISAPSP